MKKDTLQYYTVYKKESEGGYTAIAPSLPGCVSYGKTLDEAKEMVEDAIKGYLVSLRKHKEPIPPPDVDVMAGMVAVNGFRYA